MAVINSALACPSCLTLAVLSLLGSSTAYTLRAEDAAKSLAVISGGRVSVPILHNCLFYSPPVVNWGFHFPCCILCPALPSRFSQGFSLPLSHPHRLCCQVLQCCGFPNPVIQFLGTEVRSGSDFLEMSIHWGLCDGLGDYLSNFIQVVEATSRVNESQTSLQHFLFFICSCHTHWAWNDPQGKKETKKKR